MKLTHEKALTLIGGFAGASVMLAAGPVLPRTPASGLFIVFSAFSGALLFGSAVNLVVDSSSFVPGKDIVEIKQLMAQKRPAPPAVEQPAAIPSDHI